MRLVDLGTLVSCALVVACGSDPKAERDSQAQTDVVADVADVADVAAEVDSAVAPDAEEVADVGPGVAPTASLREAPAEVVAGEPAVVIFDWADADGDVAAVVATRSNGLGTKSVRLNPASLGMSGASGAVTLQIPTRHLPFGPSVYELVLEDAAGNGAAPISFTIDVRGAGTSGSGPTLTATGTQTVTRPTRGFVTPALSIEALDVDGDIDRLRVAIDGPVRDHTFEEVVADGSGALRPLRFTAEDALGDYRVTLTAFDRNAHASTPVTVTVTLAASGGVAPPAITSVVPSSGAAGAEVVISGVGFDAEPLANVVTFAGVAADVSAATPTSLTVVVPAAASTGRLQVRVPDGLAVYESAFTIPARVTIDAESRVVVAGGTLQLTASVVSATDPVTWSADAGTIDADGLLRAPAAPGTVVVTARAGSLSDTFEVLVSAPPGRVLAAHGGHVLSEDGRARLDVPAGAIASDQNITITPMHLRPTALAGRRIEAAASFEPSGLVFTPPATVTLALDRAFAPGTVLTLRQALATGFGDPVPAIVDASGLHASALVAHFSDFVMDGPQLPSGAPAPTLDAISPSTLVEGLRVPVRVTGSELTADLQVFVRRAGSVDGDIGVSGLQAVGDEAGVTLDVGVIADLADQATRTYELVFVTPEGRESSVSFEVEGLDEWVVPPGLAPALVNPPARVYSAVDIRGTLPLAAGILDVTATRRMAITGAIEAAGAPGDAADGQARGVALALAGHGGFGRGGGQDDRAHGGNAVICWGTEPGCDRVASRPLGQGGAPGEDIGLFESIVSAIVNLVGCVTGNLVACVSLISDIVAIVEDAGTLSEDGGHGKGGSGAAVGGGGGGGGGAGSDDYLVYSVTGGGGGAGGEPGRGVHLLSVGSLVLDGPISTAGGRGGDGSQVGTATVFGIDVGNSSGYGGGGGGGGGSGSLNLTAGQAIARGPAASLTSTSGEGGTGGYLEVEDDDGSVRHFHFRSGVGGRGRVGGRRVSDPLAERGAPIFDPATIDNGVSGRTVHVVRFQAAAADPKVRVVGESASRVFDVEIVGGRYQATLVLYPGFNTIAVGRVSPGSGTFDPSTPALLQKTVLVVATDTDADGLSDGDEAVLGTDPNVGDSDGDGVLDGSEVAAGTSPLSDDSDGDGLFDATEIGLGLDPTDADSDDDGASDGLEVVVNSNPQSDASRPSAIPSGLLLAQRGADLMALDPVRGLLGTIGRPAGGLGFGLAAGAGGRLYIAGLTALATANPLTAAPTPVGAYGVVGPTTLRTTTIVWDPNDLVLYGVEHGPSPGFAPTGQILRIDPVTGMATRVGLASSAIHALAFDSSGVLWASVATAADDQLARLDPTTGALTTIGSTGARGVFGLAFAGTTLWATATDGAETSLYMIDVATGAATLGASLPGVVYDLTGRPAAGPAPSGCTPTTSDDCNNNSVPDDCDVQPMFSPLGDIFTDGYGDLVAGDVDGDLDVDLVTLGASGTVLLENDGAGTFAAPANLSTIGGGLAIGDVDGDLDLDLVVASSVTDTVTVLENDGNGVFTAGQSLATGTNPDSVVLTDLDDDGDLDLAVANRGVSQGFGWVQASVSIAFNRADVQGTYFDPDVSLPMLNDISALVAVDLDSDGASELVVHSAGPRVIRNNGLGGLTADGTALAFGFGYSGFAVIDVDGDSDLDFVHGTELWLNDGAGTLTPGTLLPSLGTFGVLDLDGDGDVDLALGSPGSTPVTLLDNDASGAFTPRVAGVTTPGGYGTVASAVADFDGDGRDDFALVSYGFQFGLPGTPWFAGVSVFLNHGFGGYDVDGNGTVDSCP